MSDTPGHNVEPWVVEYVQFVLSESQQEPVNAQYVDIAEGDLLQTVDMSYAIMDAVVASSYGRATYDNLVGGAWQEIAKGRPHIAEGMLRMAGVNTNAFDLTLINLN